MFKIELNKCDLSQVRDVNTTDITLNKHNFHIYVISSLQITFGA
jgi:hypothetical protein